MKNFLLIMSLAFAFLATNANATVISGVNFGNGQIGLVGNIYFNTDVTQGGELVSQGIGQILTIHDSTGLIWDAPTAGVEFNFVFDNITLDLSETGSISTTFANILGDVNFFSNTIGTFSTTGVFGTDSAAIQTGTNLLTASGHGVGADNWTVTGTSNFTSISGNGNLDVVGGIAYDLIVQDSYIMSDQSLTDMSFNFGGDKLLTNGYDWQGSSDFATVTTAVPEPNIIPLLGLGLLGMTFGMRKRIL